MIVPKFWRKDLNIKYRGQISIVNIMTSYWIVLIVSYLINIKNYIKMSNSCASKF